ncbi:hypothetical protein HAX54_017949 [Datura stramonium]|uniref:SHSP domain-containing protein n=1 Tax=Datura stramonium TaxID=4076 RepID=A0ABS8S0X3_DATST|nr:hypothetical protein [Datura stramonium]
MENGYKDSCSCCSNSRIFEDFVPSSEIVHGKDYDTLLLNLPGFKKEEVKVQLCKTGILKISGERPVNKFLSFQKDIFVAIDCDKSKINARLVNGILYVKHPKYTTSLDKQEKEYPAPSASYQPEQYHKKTELDDAENSPAKQEPKTSEQTQVIKPDDDTPRNASSGLFAKLKVSRQVMNMALAALVVLGIGRYVVNVMRSPKRAKE